MNYLNSIRLLIASSALISILNIMISQPARAGESYIDGDPNYSGNYSSSTPSLVPLELYWSDERKDNFVTATPSGKRSAVGYTYIRTEACVFSRQEQGTVPLRSYWNPQRFDNFTTATSKGFRDARDAAYTFVRTEGYVYPSQRQGTVPLNLYWSSQRVDNYTTGTRVGSRSARDAGYAFIRTEGYAFPADQCN